MVKEDSPSAKFGLLSEIYDGLVDLEDFFLGTNPHEDEPLQLLYAKCEKFLSPDFERDLQRIVVQNEIEKYRDRAILSSFF
jgi:hypothetical protein